MVGVRTVRRASLKKIGAFHRSFMVDGFLIESSPNYATFVVLTV